MHRVRVSDASVSAESLTAFSSTRSPEYVDNLKDEGRVCGIVDRVLNYMEGKGSTEEICRIYLRRIMHTYYKFDYKAHRRSLGLQGETKVRAQPRSNRQVRGTVIRLVPCAECASPPV